MLETSILLSSAGHAGGVPDDAISDLEASHARAESDDHAGDVLPEDGRVVEREESPVLEVAVDGVDGDGLVLHQDLIGAWCPDGSRLYHERMRLGVRDDRSRVIT